MTNPAVALEQEEPAPAKRRNPHALLPTLRWVVQGAHLLFFVLVGIEFHSFYRQIVSGGPVTAHRPPAVEGFLPISALVSLKRLLLTGRYDEVHPAGLTILIAAILSSFLARKVFCSWVCPVGGISRALEWVGKKTLWRRQKRETLVNRRADSLRSSRRHQELLVPVPVPLRSAIGACQLDVAPAGRARRSDLHRLQGVHPGLSRGDHRPPEGVGVDPRVQPVPGGR